MSDHLDGLRESLRWAVPLRSIEFVHQHTPDTLAQILPGMATRGGITLGSSGDAFMFTGDSRKRTIRAWGDLVDGIAAAALLAGPDGLTILGVHFCPAVTCTHQTEAAA